MATKHEIYKWTLYYDGEGMSNGKTAIAYDIPNCLAAVANSIASTIPFFSTDFEHTTGSFQDPIKTIAEKYLPGIDESTTDNKAAVGTDARCAYVVPKRIINGMDMGLINGVTLNGGTYEKDGEEYEYQTNSVTLKVLTGSEATHTYDTNQAVCLVDLYFDVEYEDTQIERFFYVGNSSAEAISSTCTYRGTINSADTTQHNVYYVTNLSSSDVQSLTFATGGASGMFDSVVFDHATNRIIFTCSSNSGSQRTGYIYVKNGSTTIATITVNQAAGATYTLTAYTGTSGTATAASISYGSTTVPIRIQSNQAWTATSSQSWATLDTSTGNGDTQINVSVGSNAGSTSSRSANITITAAHGETCTISISQAGYNPGPGPSYTYTLVVEWEDGVYRAYPGEHLTAKAYIYRDGVEYTEVTNECSWTSDYTSIATVNNSNNKGDVTAVSVGGTGINAEYDGTYGYFTESLYAEVIAVPTYNISVSPASLTGLSTAQTSQSVTVTTTNQGWGIKSKPDWITSIYPQSSSYAGSNNVSFYVQQNTGGVRDGYIVFSGTVSGEASVYVQQTGDTTIFFNVYIDDGSSGSTTSVTINDTVDCVALFGPGAQDVTTSATWELDDNTMGSISSSGVFTPSKSGTVKITASYQGYHSNNFIRVNVSEETVISYSLEVTPSYQTLESGTTTVVSYTATLYTYENGTQTNSENVTTSVYTNWSLSSTTYCSVGNTTTSNRGKVTLTSNPPYDTDTTVIARYRNTLRGIDESGSATVYINHYEPQPTEHKLELSRYSYSSSPNGGSITINVSSTGQTWAVSDKTDWITGCTPTTGAAGNTTVTISWGATETGRTGTITFTGSMGDVKTFSLNQSGVSRYIEVNGSTDNISTGVSRNSGSNTVTVEGINENWSASTDSNWLTVNRTTGTSNTQYSVTISWSTNVRDARTGTTTFTGQYGDTIDYVVAQEGNEIVQIFEVTADDYSLEPGDYTQCYAYYGDVNHTSDATWSIVGSSYGSSISNSSSTKGRFTAGTVSSEQTVTVKAEWDGHEDTISITITPEEVITHDIRLSIADDDLPWNGQTTCTVEYLTIVNGVVDESQTTIVQNSSCTWGPQLTYVTVSNGIVTANNTSSSPKTDVPITVIYSGYTDQVLITIGGKPGSDRTINITFNAGTFRNMSSLGGGTMVITAMTFDLIYDNSSIYTSNFTNENVRAGDSINYPLGGNSFDIDFTISPSTTSMSFNLLFDDINGGDGTGHEQAITVDVSDTSTSNYYKDLPNVTWFND